MNFKTFTILLFSFLFFSYGHAQCEFTNPSFEDWSESTFVLSDGEGGVDSAEVIIPDDNTSFIRLFLLSFAAAFDPSVAMVLQDDAQGLLGIDQSEDASDGDFAVKLQGGYDLATSDLYGVFGCDELPDQFNLDVKHMGETNDTFLVFVIFDEGLNAIPQDEEDLANFPAYATTEMVYNSDTDYETVSIPVIQNFEAPIDTFYYLIITETAGDSYFLIDNLSFGPVDDCPVVAPTIELEDENPLCSCNPLEVYVELLYDRNPEFDYESVILDSDGVILGIDEGGFGVYDDFCSEEEGLKTAVVASQGPIEGLFEGNNISNLEGCFEVSNQIDLNTYFLPEFEFNVFLDGVAQEEDFELCLIDDVIETLSFSIDLEPEKIVIFLIDENSEIAALRIDDIDETTTFEGITEGDYSLGAIIYDGSFNLEVGQDIDELTYEGCLSISENVYYITVLGPDQGCVTDVDEVYTGLLSVQPNFSNGLFEINNPNNEQFDLKISDLTGKQILNKSSRELKGVIDLAAESSGLYIANFRIDGKIYTQKLVRI